MTTKTIKAPKLPHGCGSWVLIEREPPRAILETFSRKNADSLARQLASADTQGRYALLPASEWLGNLAPNVKRMGDA